MSYLQKQISYEDREERNMGLFDFFKASKEECANDDCLKNVMSFINTIVSFESRDMDCPMLSVSCDKEEIRVRFFDSEHSAPCGYQNMLHRKQAEENAINQLIGKAIRADELPQGAKIEFHFDNSNDEYDYYILIYNVKTTYRKCASEYCEIIRDLCNRKGIEIEKQEGTTLHIAMRL